VLRRGAAGHGIGVLPLSVAAFYSRTDITHVAIHDIAPNRICLAWDGTRRSRIIQEFAALAAEHSTTVAGQWSSGSAVVPGTASATRAGRQPLQR
jgi:DNA-binding transcriptional LysR family regulator